MQLWSCFWKFSLDLVSQEFLHLAEMSLRLTFCGHRVSINYLSLNQIYGTFFMTSLINSLTNKLWAKLLSVRNQFLRNYI